MNRLLLIGFLLIGLASCKSIKKVKQKESATVSMMKMAAVVDSSAFVLEEKAKEVEEVQITETTKQTFVPLDSAGLTIFKPVTLTTKTTKSVRTADSVKNEQNITVESNRKQESSAQVTISKDLDKSSESEQVIGHALDAFFPKWGKILASILIAVVPVIWGIWKKKKAEKP
jgi:hypothetical protein